MGFDLRIGKPSDSGESVAADLEKQWSLRALKSLARGGRVGRPDTTRRVLPRRTAEPGRLDGAPVSLRTWQNPRQRQFRQCVDLQARGRRVRVQRNMPPVISTIVRLRLFARRQRTSMAAYFTNALTPPTGLGLLASPLAAGNSRSGSAWLGRSQKDGLPSCRAGGRHFIRGSRPSTRAQGGQPGRCPF